MHSSLNCLSKNVNPSWPASNKPIHPDNFMNGLQLHDNVQPDFWVLIFQRRNKCFELDGHKVTYPMLLCYAMLCYCLRFTTTHTVIHNEHIDSLLIVKWH